MWKQWHLRILLSLLVIGCVLLSLYSAFATGLFNATIVRAAWSASLQATPSVLPAPGPDSALVVTSSAGSSQTTISYHLLDYGQRSLLRHGHREFTVDLEDGTTSLIIAFYGYNGPGSYRLQNGVNGGDVRLAAGKQYWDLALQPQASCTLRILSQSPTAQADIDRLRGNVVCPLVAAGPANETSKPVALRIDDLTISLRIAS